MRMLDASSMSNHQPHEAVRQTLAPLTIGYLAPLSPIGKLGFFFRQVRIRLQWLPVTAKVTKSEVAINTYNDETEDMTDTLYILDIELSYRANGISKLCNIDNYRTIYWKDFYVPEMIRSRHPVGSNLTIWLNPESDEEFFTNILGY